MQLPKNPLGLLQDVATKKVVKQFAHKFDLVYFGYVDQREDEHELVRGITLSAKHVDNHYTIGHFRGHDVTLVQRRDRLEFPNKPVRDYTWMILEIDLRKANLPHIFIDANHHDETFYANLFIKFASFQSMNQSLSGHDSLFMQRFKAYAEQNEQAIAVLTPAITSMLAHHFSHFDYELHEDKLLVYASDTIITLHILQEMLRVGLWLAEKLENPTDNLPPAS